MHMEIRAPNLFLIRLQATLATIFKKYSGKGDKKAV